MENRAARRLKARAKSNAKKPQTDKPSAEPTTITVNQTWSTWERAVIIWLETLHKDFLELGAKLDRLIGLFGDPEPESEEGTEDTKE